MGGLRLRSQGRGSPIRSAYAPFGGTAGTFALASRSRRAMGWIAQNIEDEAEGPALLRLKAAEFLAIAASTKSPGIAAEARLFADRCITRAIELDAHPTASNAAVKRRA